jgi:hypothetical protein
MPISDSTAPASAKNSSTSSLQVNAQRAILLAEIVLDRLKTAALHADRMRHFSLPASAPATQVTTEIQTVYNACFAISPVQHVLVERRTSVSLAKLPTSSSVKVLALAKVVW